MAEQKGLGGLVLVLTGAIFLMVAYFAGWSDSNLVLVAGLMIIIVGTIVYVKAARNC
jgi:hypothetical protein